MSGRSALVRLDNQKAAESKQNIGTGLSKVSAQDTLPIDTRYDYPPGFQNVAEPSPLNTVLTHSSGDLNDLNRSRTKPAPTYSVATIESIGIPKSNTRDKMDAFSENVRSKLTFGKNKGKAATQLRPSTAAGRGSSSFDLPIAVATPTLGTPTLAAPTIASPTLSQAPVQPPPTSPLPEVSNLQQIRKYTGGQSYPTQWRCMGLDPELWDSQGDTVVYLLHQDSYSGKRQVTPSLRVSSRTLVALGLITMDEQLAIGNIDYSGSDMGGNLEYTLDPHSVRLQYAVQAKNAKNALPSSGSDSGSEDYLSLSFELKFLAKHTLRTDPLGVLKYHIAARNFFAMIFGKSLVGMNMASALADLQQFIHDEFPDLKEPNAQIHKWLDRTGITDIRCNPNNITGLLAWYEHDTCRNSEGYITAFCHAAAMYVSCERTAEWEHLSLVSRRMVQNAHEIIEMKTKNVEDFLTDFDHNRIWPASNDPSLHNQSDARSAAHSFRQFLVKHYQAEYRTWPPEATGSWGRWCDRKLLKRLTTDFGALYDYLVDRDVQWKKIENGTDPTRLVELKSKTDPNFQADTKDMNMTALLLKFDKTQGCLRIPAPYPHVPISAPVPVKKPKQATKVELPKVEPAKKGIWGKSKAQEQAEESDRKAINVRTVAKEIAERRKFALAFNMASNIYRLGDEFPKNTLLEAYIEFERVDLFGKIDPFDARRGRWVVIYMILQVLASILVDVPDCKFKNDVPYFLCAQLKGTPPWKGARTDFVSATPKLSYCWQARRKWFLEDFAEVEAQLAKSPSFPLPPTGPLPSRPKLHGVQTAPTPSPMPSSPSSPTNAAWSGRASVEMSVGVSTDRDTHFTQYSQSARSSSSMSSYTAPIGENAETIEVARQRVFAREKARRVRYQPVNELLLEGSDEDRSREWPIKDKVPRTPVSEPMTSYQIYGLSAVQYGQVDNDPTVVRVDSMRATERQKSKSDRLTTEAIQRQPSNSELSADRTLEFVQEQNPGVSIYDPQYFNRLRKDTEGGRVQELKDGQQSTDNQGLNDNFEFFKQEPQSQSQSEKMRRVKTTGHAEVGHHIQQDFNEVRYNPRDTTTFVRAGTSSPPVPPTPTTTFGSPELQQYRREGSSVALSPRVKKERKRREPALEEGGEPERRQPRVQRERQPAQYHTTPISSPNKQPFVQPEREAAQQYRTQPTLSLATQTMYTFVQQEREAALRDQQEREAASRPQQSAQYPYRSVFTSGSVNPEHRQHDDGRDANTAEAQSVKKHKIPAIALYPRSVTHQDVGSRKESMPGRLPKAPYGSGDGAYDDGAYDYDDDDDLYDYESIRDFDEYALR